jgi:hypothetical protein
MVFPRWYLEVVINVEAPNHNECCKCSVNPFFNEFETRTVIVSPELACYLIQILESGDPDRGMEDLFYRRTCFTCSSHDPYMEGQETLHSYRLCRVPKLKVGIEDAVKYLKLDVLIRVGWGNWKTAVNTLHIRSAYSLDPLVIRARSLLYDDEGIDVRTYITCEYDEYD